MISRSSVRSRIPPANSLNSEAAAVAGTTPPDGSSGRWVSHAELRHHLHGGGHRDRHRRQAGAHHRHLHDGDTGRRGHHVRSAAAMSSATRTGSPGPASTWVIDKSTDHHDEQSGVRLHERRRTLGRLDRPMNVRGPGSFHAWNAEDRRTSPGPPTPARITKGLLRAAYLDIGWPPYISSSSPGTPPNRSWTWLHSHDIPVRNPSGHSPRHRDTGQQRGQLIRRGPGSKQHKINDWLPCPDVALPGLVGCLDPA